MHEYEAKVEEIQNEKWLFEEYFSGNIDADAYRVWKPACDDRIKQIKYASTVLTAQAKFLKTVEEKQNLAGQAMAG